MFILMVNRGSSVIIMQASYTVPGKCFTQMAQSKKQATTWMASAKNNGSGTILMAKCIYVATLPLMKEMGPGNRLTPRVSFGGKDLSYKARNTACGKPGQEV